MRRQFSLMGFHAMAAAAALLAMPVTSMLAIASEPERRLHRPRRPLVTNHFDPRINRWTGRPHENRREIARRLKAGAAA